MLIKSNPSKNRFYRKQKTIIYNKVIITINKTANLLIKKKHYKKVKKLIQQLDK